MGWSKTVPVSGSKMLLTPSIYQNNWEAMEGITSDEHYGMDSSLSGRHQPGYVGSMNVTANAKLAGLSPQSGALAWVTDVGSAFGIVRSGQASAWKQANYHLPTTRVVIVGATSVTATNGVNCFFLSGGTETTGTLGEWNSTTGIFSAVGKGYFVFNMFATLSGSVAGGESFGLGLSGTCVTAGRVYQTISGANESFSFSTMASVGSGISIAPYINSSVQTLQISGGDGATYLQIFRIS